MTLTLEEAPAISTHEDLLAAEPVEHSVEPISSLLNHTTLVKMMVMRDFKGRYRGSLLGALWPLIHPVGHLLLYTFVFCIVLKVRFGADASTSNFSLYLMSGLLAWGAISESIARSTTCILEVPNLVKRVVFPLEVIPIVVALSSVTTQVGGMLILIACAIVYQGAIHASLLFIPAIAFSQILFTTGICWLLGSLGVYVRDIRHLVTLGLSVWMYMTPIVYPASALPENLKFLVWINPVAGIVTDYRRVILENKSPDFTMYAFYTAIAVVFFFSGYYFFMKTKRSFADVM
ncbi:MAG: ABC transporter permease [Candidatus Obscuribacterales bacterium]|nr:ABC transporter permease [Candidatus Obscuribacterales bacterium]